MLRMGLHVSGWYDGGTNSTLKKALCRNQKKKKNENEEFDNQVFRPIALLEIP